jgi:hypothetical protein
MGTAQAGMPVIWSVVMIGGCMCWHAVGLPLQQAEKLR